MAKRIIETEKAPRAVGPYSQAVESGPYLFISGQIPIDPATGELVKTDITGQTKRVMENIKAILQSRGLAAEHVVKTTVYLADMTDFTEMNKVYAECFSADPPARATVEVSRLPLGVKVEIEAVAAIG